MIQAGSHAHVRMLVRLIALHAIGYGRRGITGGIEAQREGKCQQKQCDRIRCALRRHADWIALGNRHFDGGRLMNGLLRRIVLRQPAMHNPAEYGQHHDKQAHAEPPT